MPKNLPNHISVIETRELLIPRGIIDLQLQYVLSDCVENQLMIKFNEKMISYHDKFRLFITTKLANPHYAPEISTKTTLCNFAIKEQGN